MKKLVLMAVAIVAVSFASCGNKAADAAKAQQDSIAAVEAAAAEAEQAAAQAAADSLNADSTATEAVAE